MTQMMSDYSMDYSMWPMTWLMVAFWLLIAAGLVPGIAALIKYLFKK